MEPISEKAMAVLRGMQRDELTEHHIYRRIARRVKDGKNREVLLQIGDDEKSHAERWKEYTGEDVKPRKLRILWFSVISVLFGYTFALKLMERGESSAGNAYEKLEEEVPEARKIAEEENSHEQKLLGVLDEERLRYVGSMVLGLNDALVELSGTLAGLTFAMRRTDLVALSGLITGIAATLSMASSEYLSSRSEGRPDALKSSVYTGIAYLITVALLVLPYLLLPAGMYLTALFIMLALVALIILVFNYYISVAQNYNFKRRFGEMAAISMGVAALSFALGLVVKQFLGVDI
ncbi:MAG: VIT1/CCC1 family protein [Oscillospiraceae bacterium]|nr:VIT1/CCC1 family protein [Oscillospiraceae bacterium]